MKPSYTAAERRAIEAAVAAGGPLRCPVCDATLGRQPVEPPPGVPYVRQRVWVVCPGCRRTASVDVRGG